MDYRFLIDLSFVSKIILKEIIIEFINKKYLDNKASL